MMWVPCTHLCVSVDREHCHPPESRRHGNGIAICRGRSHTNVHEALGAAHIVLQAQVRREGYRSYCQRTFEFTASAKLMP